MSMSCAILLLLALYLAKISLFLSGTIRASRERHAGIEPTVTIIVAARDEEANIGRCIDSLARIDYPREKLEIIIVDDQSSDATADSIRSACGGNPVFRLLATRGQVHGLHGKANAVAQAIERAGGEIIMTTDADCAVPPGWVRETVALYTPDVGCVCGFTLLETTGAFSGMQSIDWAYLLTLASAGVGWNFPLSAVGNNMSFRRAAYDCVGGYAGVGFSVTEDFILFKAIGYRSPWKIRYPVAAGQLVWSKPCGSFRNVYQQKKRWGRGGLAMHPVGFMIMAVGFLMSIALLATPWLGVSWPAWLTALAGKCLGDAVLLFWSLRRLGQLRLFRYFHLFELYYIVYVTALPFVVLFTGRVVWKGRKL